MNAISTPGMFEAEEFKTARAMMVSAIKRKVCEHFDVELSDLQSDRRCREQIAFARHVAYVVARDMSGLSYPALGREFGRDHSTVIAGCRRIDNMVKADRRLARAIEKITFSVQAELGVDGYEHVPELIDYAFALAVGKMKQQLKERALADPAGFLKKLMALAIASIALFATPVFASPSVDRPAAVTNAERCDSRSTMASTLLKDFNEAPIASAHNGALTLEIFATPTGDSWTAMYVTSDGWACIVDFGGNWIWKQPRREFGL